MCLFPMGGMMNQGAQVEGSPKAKKLKMILYVCIVIHIGLAIFMMFTGDGIFGGIFELLTCLILYCGLSRYDFCCVLFYMFLNLLSAIQRFALLGLFVQIKLSEYNSADVDFKPTAIVCSALLLVYYIPAIWISFLAYKEFKAMVGEAPPAGVQGGDY
jgi:hypothetical protein